MVIQRKVVIVFVAITALILAAKTGVFAGVQLIEKYTPPFVVDIMIMRSIPIEISAPVVLDRGDSG